MLQGFLGLVGCQGSLHRLEATLSKMRGKHKMHYQMFNLFYENFSF